MTDGPLPRTSLATLNSCSLEEFIEICGPFFEHSPWIAQRTFALHPFRTVDALHASLVGTVAAATPDEQLGLIRAHPDLVGRLAREGQLTAESTREQAAAGLEDLQPHEVKLFNTYNAEYQERFGFPFVICARENRKNDILMSFPRRLRSSPEEERKTALEEIAKIARLRLQDRIEEMACRS